VLDYATSLSGDWHVHSNFTDGRSTVWECCEAARAQGLQLIVITEHVRRELTYDFGAFVEAVDAARRDFPELTILRGCEAKVLDEDGELDVSDDVVAHCDVVLGAFHGFPHSSCYVTAVLNMLSNPRVDVWAHPTLHCRKRGLVLSPIQTRQLIEQCRHHGVLLELNGRYRLPASGFLAAAERAGLQCVWGSDAHHASEVGRRWTGVDILPPRTSLSAED
jgi:DNA polymerase (family 10)/putative hydrolase